MKIMYMYIYMCTEVKNVCIYIHAHECEQVCKEVSRLRNTLPLALHTVGGGSRQYCLPRPWAPWSQPS